jgi:hypothetical protein
LSPPSCYSCPPSSALPRSYLFQTEPTQPCVADSLLLPWLTGTSAYCGHIRR